MTAASETNEYCARFIPSSTLEKLEAGAYQQLCEHLRRRSKEVQNIDLMTISGFCRNCLAKWLVVEARRLSDDMKKNPTGAEEATTIQVLDAMGYDEAAEYVYGMGYGEWKKRYSKKSTDAALEKYNASKSLHATHDKDLLATRAARPENVAGNESTKNSTLVSNVCCQAAELEAAPASNRPKVALAGSTDVKQARVVTPQVPPPPPGSIKFRVGILTISDRASSGEYATGDLSGPAVAESVSATVKSMIQMKANDGTLEYKLVQSAIVPDDNDAIQGKLKEWSSGDAALDLILTTGGTGFAPRDVTPEATSAILERECHGLMSFISSECSKMQPLAALSRGTAGVRGRTLIANLPGNPKGVGEVVPLLLPLALHAIVDLQKT